MEAGKNVKVEGGENNLIDLIKKDEMFKPVWDHIDEILDAGFCAVQMARALVHDTDFVNKLRDGDENTVSGCNHSNYCIGRMYTLDMKCHCQCDDEIPPKLKKEIAKLEAKWGRKNA